LCTALLLNEIYHPMKFQVHSFFSWREMARTKLKYENEQTAITQKIRTAEYRSLCTALSVIERSMHTKFEVNQTYSDWVMLRTSFRGRRQWCHRHRRRRQK
jgi:hypothetical protein